MGALNTLEILAQLEDTPALRDLELDGYDAIVVCGARLRCSSSASTPT
jgi:hypothetical protein